MTKTPEQMAEEYATATEQEFSLEEEAGAYKGFLAGYQVARDQFADTGKVVTADYVETASNDAKELIAKFELQGDQDMLIKALVAAYCRGVDAVDGYLRNSLSAYRNSVKRLQWISVKERLPEIGAPCLVTCHEERYTIAEHDGIKWTTLNSIAYYHPIVTHWQPLPEAPKGEE